MSNTNREKGVRFIPQKQKKTRAWGFEHHPHLEPHDHLYHRITLDYICKKDIQIETRLASFFNNWAGVISFLLASSGTLNKSVSVSERQPNWRCVLGFNTRKSIIQTWCPSTRTPVDKKRPNITIVIFWKRIRPKKTSTLHELPKETWIFGLTKKTSNFHWL